jgi:hypothetical protein
MIEGLREGRSVWAVLGIGQQVGDDDAVAAVRAEVYAVAASRELALDIRYELRPYLLRDVVAVYVQEVPLIEPYD